MRAPMPLVAPVTMAVFPFSWPIESSPLFEVGALLFT
jgi:hypothetical protein